MNLATEADTNSFFHMSGSLPVSKRLHFSEVLLRTRNVSARAGARVCVRASPCVRACACTIMLTHLGTR